MAIERNAVVGNYIKEAGEYKVKVTKIEMGTSKKGDPMLTVKLETASGASIKAYFVKTQAFMMKNLDSLKIACGLTAASGADDLVGKECGILVELTEKNDRVNTNIVGYGPAANVSGDFQKADDQIPF